MKNLPRGPSFCAETWRGRVTDARQTCDAGGRSRQNLAECFDLPQHFRFQVTRFGSNTRCPTIQRRLHLSFRLSLFLPPLFTLPLDYLQTTSPTTAMSGSSTPPKTSAKQPARVRDLDTDYADERYVHCIPTGAGTSQSKPGLQTHQGVCGSFEHRRVHRNI